MNCPRCGETVADNAVFCHKCGMRLAERGAGNEPAEPRSVRDQYPSDEVRGHSAADPSHSSRDPASPRGAARPAEHLRPRPSATADDDEQPVWDGGFSGKAMIGSWLLAAAITVGVVALGYYTGPFSYKARILTGVAVVVWLLPLARLVYRKLSIRYRLTSQRLFHEEGILRRTTNRVELIDADDVTVQRSIIDRMMNVGTVRIESSDRSHPELLLVGIEDPLDVAEKIDAARRRERLRRGIHIEAV